MAHYKFVGELHFEADSMEDALAKLGLHYKTQSEGDVSYLLLEGSSEAIGQPAEDPPLDSVHLVDFNQHPELLKFVRKVSS